jgi:actin-related protein
MGNVVLTGGGSQFSGFADRLNSELTRTFPHVRITSCYFCYISVNFVTVFVNRLKSMLLVTQLKEDTVVGLVVAFWPVWARFINCGLARKNGRYVEVL